MFQRAPNAQLHIAHIARDELLMRHIVLGVVCLTLLARATVSRADYTQDFNGPFPIEGTSYSISQHKRDPVCVINTYFVNGAALAIFQMPQGWLLLFTPDGGKVWPSSVESAKITLYVDSSKWEVNRAFYRSPDGRAIVINIDGATEASFITDLSRARDLMVYMNGRYQGGFSLKGSSRALTSLGTCVNNYTPSTSTHTSQTPDPRDSRYERSAKIGDKLRDFFRR